MKFILSDYFLTSCRLADGRTFGKCRLAPLVKMILKDINWQKITNIDNENTDIIL